MVVLGKDEEVEEEETNEETEEVREEFEFVFLSSVASMLTTLKLDFESIFEFETCFIDSSSI